MHLQRNFYEVLGLPQAATTDEIKRKYRELARKFHPDLVEDKALGQRIFTQVNQAYRTLSDPERRAQYDATLHAPTSRAMANGRPQANIITGTGTVGPQNGTVNRSAVEIDKMVRDADMAMISGQAANAQALCEAVLKSDPNNAQALSILGDALMHQKKNDEAMRAYRRSLSVQPSSIVEAKLTRLQTMAHVTSAASATTVVKPNGTARPAAKAEAPANRGLIDRLLKRK
jgi:curved DNA-binding protein CbpA